MSLVWKITNPINSYTSYLLGTMHIQPKGNPNWMQPFLPLLKECEGFASEFDLEDINTALLTKQTLLPDNQLLTDFISPKKIAKLERIFLKSAGLPIQGLMRTKPLFITNLLTEKILTDDAGVSMDSELYQIAKKMNKDCGGIETFAEQLVVLNKIPLEYQVKSLLKIGKNISRFRQHLKQMFAIYESGDVQKIHKMAKKGMGSMRKTMLYQRNVVMADRIYEKIHEKAIFCAIGAGHLGGKKGVLRLLKHKGLRVSRQLRFVVAVGIENLEPTTNIPNNKF